jgi:hypothetical protein
VLDRPLDRLRRGRVRRASVLDPERPDRGAAQANEVGAAPERPADVGHQHPHVRPARAGDQDLEIAAVEAGHLERIDPDLRVALKLGVAMPTAAADAALAAAIQDAAGEGDGDVDVSFNAEGHHIVAMIAMRDLQTNTPATATKVQNLLDSVNRTLREAATFPDDIKQKQPKTKPFHFIDIPFEDGGPVNPELPDPPHVLSRIATAMTFLANGGGTAQEKVDEMSWLIHLIGDIHQPLHCAEHISALHPGGDRGGNSFKIHGKGSNLHSLWDSSVDFKNTDEDELVLSLMQEHTRATLAADLQVNDAEAWARTSFALAKKHAYQPLHENPAKPPTPSATYLKSANKVGRRQAALAGYRLADRFKTLFHFGTGSAQSAAQIAIVMLAGNK